MTSHATIFATDWCPFCKRLIADLDSSQTTYDIIDVEADDAAAEWVMSVNDGNRVVPTVKYSDGTHATNPPADDVRAKIAELAAAAQ